MELLFSQYVAFVQRACIPDFGGSGRRSDYLMVDARGNVDVLEIKRPFDNEVMLASSTYRDNYIPALEARLTERLARDGLIPSDLPLRFTSPKGLVIMGRDPEGERLRDFDFVRRQYAGTVDVITYDDLIRRFWRIVEAMGRKTDGGRTDSADVR
ncbi:Shedu anti-phage system protein SduA domain-containing protein [Olsenella uli]|uniref:Shedu anti-phage system protein SduA domain-containing protein n=1 Tax=Olsenella uli TaxID=133926 RepID=UPI00165117D7|nr:Shedu anti-phage system protein SduA domain-containing protein [Olsenella uli]